MADPWQQGDDEKNKFLEKALHANEEEASKSTMSDLFDRESNVYQDTNKENMAPKEKEPIPEKPTVDAEGFPIIDRVHTYRADLADIIKEDKLSLSRIAMMQDKANQNLSLQKMASEKKISPFIVIGGILVLIGIGIMRAVFLFSSKKSDEALQAEAPKEKYIIFAESKERLSLDNTTKTEISAAVKSSTKKFKEEDAVMEIVPSIGADASALRATLPYLFGSVGVRMPADFARTLGNKLFLGLYSKKGKTDPFLLFYTSTYDIAYPSLRTWAGFMQDDLDWIFETKPKIGTSTPVLFFKDRIIANKDARSFEDDSGRTAFFYMFLDNNTILFARSSDTARKVIDRLREAKF